MAGTSNPLFETDIPERKNQNIQMMKYLFHFTSGRQGRFRGLRADLRIALMDSIICLGTSRGGWLD
ncbi:hypothetical protein, partial [Mesorhizobium sp. M7A.F.Ca.CA.001.16.1.1]|uniref:hypothetical protein n=1 Tax=Mesorhizobium sp. M7A.F.Ca.CA.001.16.1.1 TaxID=2496683 RepID=UPI0019D47EE2